MLHLLDSCSNHTTNNFCCNFFLFLTDLSQKKMSTKNPEQFLFLGLQFDLNIDNNVPWDLKKNVGNGLLRNSTDGNINIQKKTNKSNHCYSFTEFTQTLRGVNSGWVAEVRASPSTLVVGKRGPGGSTGARERGGEEGKSCCCCCWGKGAMM